MGEIVARPLVSGFAAGKNDQDDDNSESVPQLRPTNILPDGSITFDGAKNIPPENVSENDLIEAGEILFNNTNSSAWVGKSAVYQSTRPAVCSNHVTRLRVRPDFEPRFVAEVLNALQRLGYFATLATNFNNQAGVNSDVLAAVSLPLGDPDNREKMLGDLDTARAKRDALLSAADLALEGLDAFVLSELGINLPPSHGDAPFAVNCASLRNGGKIFPNYYNPDRRHAVAELQRVGADALENVVQFVREQRTITLEDVTYVGLANVRSNTGEHIDADEEVGGMVSVFAKGDVLFAKLRPYLNKVWVADRAGVCSPEFHVLRLLPDGPVISAEYLAAMLRSSPTLAQTKRMMTGNTHPRLAPEDVVELVVATPSPDAQRIIATEVDRRRAESRRLHRDAHEGWGKARQAFENALLGTAA